MSYTLKDFLNAYNQNPNIVIKGFKLTGWGSWRGSYDEPCIYMTEDENSSVEFSEIIGAINKLTNGTVFHGWKGGEYTYNIDDLMNIEPCLSSYTDGEHEAYIFVKCPELFLTLNLQEDEQMTQTIKPNDFVYIPHISTCIFTAKPSYGEKLCVYYGYEQEEIDFLPNGKFAYDDVAPVVYLATPENKTKLEEFYGITLQDIPVDEEVEKFSKALNELSTFYANLCSSDGNFRPSDKLDELKTIKDKLIEMFKERGAK